jgi:alpha-L-fucosidase
MKLKSLMLITLLVLLVGIAWGQTNDDKKLNWRELSAIYECPDWYKDAKLGIWTHWGPQSFPLRGGGWYARHMYMKDVGRQRWGRDAYKYHQERFGHQSEVGYKDVLNQWKTPNLDTDALMKYFKENLGAKYFVAMACHHDHFDCWDSTYQPWNSVDVGPHRDLVGEFAKSARKYHLPFGVSSHDDRFLGWWLPAFGADKDGPKKGGPYDGNLTKADGKGKWWEGLDPADLYGMPPNKRTKTWIKQMKETWVKRHMELIDKYQVDYLWFDGYNFPYGSYGRSVGEKFYNEHMSKDGKISVVLAGKPYGMSNADKKGWVMDYERGVPDEPLGRPFQSITTVRTWFYKRDIGSLEPRQSARSLIEMFADVISKGGNMLLNVELTGDGRLPPDLKYIYDDFGAWINLNAEAIYGTHCWKTPGDNRPKDRRARQNLDETNVKQAKAHSEQFNERTKDSPAYPHDEVRFTVKGDKLYIFVLNPAAGKIQLASLGLKSKYKPGRISAVLLIGGDAVEFSQDDDKLTITVPEKRPSKYAAVFVVKGAI